MAQSQEQIPVSPEAMRLGYEPQWISIRGLLIFIVCAVLFMIVLHLLLRWYMNGLQGRDERLDQPRSAFETDQTPPPPQLQPSVGHDTLDAQDLQRFREQEDSIFAKLGWQVDPSTHRVAIPPRIVKQVAEAEKARAAGPYIPPTTTGKDFNSTVPGRIPPYDTRPEIQGGQRP